MLRQQHDEVFRFRRYTKVSQVCNRIVEIAPLAGIAGATLVGRIVRAQGGDEIGFPLELLVNNLIPCEHLGLVGEEVLVVLSIRGAFTVENTVDFRLRQTRTLDDLLGRDFAGRFLRKVSKCE